MKLGVGTSALERTQIRQGSNNLNMCHNDYPGDRASLEKSWLEGEVRQASGPIWGYGYDSIAAEPQPKMFECQCKIIQDPKQKLRTTWMTLGPLESALILFGHHLETTWSALEYNLEHLRQL